MVEAAQKRVNRPLSKQIKNYEISYRCIHGGKSSKPEEKGSEGHRKLISIVNSAGRCSLASHTLYLPRNHHNTVKLLSCILIVFLGDL